MEQLRIYFSGIMAGLAIALGGTVYLSVENQIIGALFFTVGLFTVCTMNFHLYTGRVCYLFENDKSYALHLPLIWLGNLTGAVLTAQLLMLTRLAPALTARAVLLCETKLSDNLGSIFILAVFCNLLIFIAVDGFKNHEHEIGKYLGLFFGVVAFILCGFEHCVANMFYIPAGMMTASAYGIAAEGLNIGTFILNNLIPATIGNIFGGVIVVGFLYWYLFLREKN